MAESKLHCDFFFLQAFHLKYYQLKVIPIGDFVKIDVDGDFVKIDVDEQSVGFW